MKVALLVVICIVIFAWIALSYAYPNAYFSAPLHSILTIVIGLFVSYYLVQRNTDARRKRDLAEKILSQIETKIEDFLVLLLKNDLNREQLFLLKRAVSNKLDKCKKINTYADFEKDIESCTGYVSELDRLLEDCITNYESFDDFIGAKRSEINRIFESIENSCDGMIVSLWTE